MICRCKPEGAAEADALVARVRDALGLKDDANFVSALVMEFNWRHGAYVELLADQWFGVHVIKYSAEDERAWISCTCDRVEDGLAACWEAAGSLTTKAQEDPESPG